MARRVSCLLATENRPEFAAFTAWNFNRQTWPNKELVVCASETPSDELFVETLRREVPADDLLVLPFAIPGTALGVKMQRCLEAARGDAIVFWADDDYRLPGSLECAMGRLEESWDHKDVVAPVFPLSMVNLKTGALLPLPQTFYVGTVVAKTEVVRAKAPFPPARCVVDTRWFGALLVKCLLRFRWAVTSLPMVTAICHGKNISNPAAGKQWPVVVSGSLDPELARWLEIIRSWETPTGEEG